jgi:large subunit ribosomal protein L13
MTTYQEKNIDQNKKTWWLINAENQIVGRLATQIANLLRGKNKTTYTPHVDTGDFVVVINADKVKFTGNKWLDKKYYDHSSFVGGLKEKTAKEMLKKHPEEILRRAVWGMMGGKGVLARNQIKKLKIYTGAEHPHKAQNVKEWVAPKKTKVS